MVSPLIEESLEEALEWLSKWKCWCQTPGIMRCSQCQLLQEFLDTTLAAERKAWEEDLKRRGRRLMIDFDGVIHDDYKGFQDGFIYGEPYPEAFAKLQRLADKGYEIVIFTTRALEPSLKREVEAWIDLQKGKRGLNFKFFVTGRKLPALAYIDDRCIRFTNWIDIEKYFR